jgi:hypothetical protein
MVDRDQLRYGTFERVERSPYRAVPGIHNRPITHRLLGSGLGGHTGTRAGRLEWGSSTGHVIRSSGNLAVRPRIAA